MPCVESLRTFRKQDLQNRTLFHQQSLCSQSFLRVPGDENVKAQHSFIRIEEKNRQHNIICEPNAEFQDFSMGEIHAVRLQENHTRLFIIDTKSRLSPSLDFQSRREYTRISSWLAILRIKCHSSWKQAELILGQRTLSDDLSDGGFGRDDLPIGLPVYPSGNHIVCEKAVAGQYLLSQRFTLSLPQAYLECQSRTYG
jgi:hypothetical protein